MNLTFYFPDNPPTPGTALAYVTDNTSRTHVFARLVYRVEDYGELRRARLEVLDRRLSVSNAQLIDALHAILAVAQRFGRLEAVDVEEPTQTLVGLLTLLRRADQPQRAVFRRLDARNRRVYRASVYGDFAVGETPLSRAAVVVNRRFAPVTWIADPVERPQRYEEIPLEDDEQRQVRFNFSFVPDAVDEANRERERRAREMEENAARRRREEEAARRRDESESEESDGTPEVFPRRFFEI